MNKRDIERLEKLSGSNDKEFEAQWGRWLDIAVECQEGNLTREQIADSIKQDLARKVVRENG